jgi:vitamin B12 transporter
MQGAVFGISASSHEHDEDTDSPGVAPGRRDAFGVPASVMHTDYARRTAQADVQLRSSLPSRLLAGVSYERESGDLDSVLKFGTFSLPADFSLTRATLAGFLEAEHDAGNLSVTAGLRLDAPDTLKPAHTFRLGAAWQPREDIVVKTSWTEGFKAPSFFALGHPIVGNPDLQPERSRSLEAGALWQSRGVEFGAVAFRTNYDDLIDFVTEPVPRLENLAHVTITGGELHGAYTVGVARLSGWLAYAGIDSPDVLEQRPRWRAGGELVWRAAATFDIALGANYIGARLDSTIPTDLVRLGAATQFDLRASWSVLEDVDVTLQTENLTNAAYEISAGVSARGRGFGLTLTATL